MPVPYRPTEHPHETEHSQEGAAGSRAVSEVMSTRLLTVDEGESVLAAWEVLRRSGYHHLPVVAADGRCSGVIDVVTLATAYARTGLSLASSPVGELLVGNTARG